MKQHTNLLVLMGLILLGSISRSPTVSLGPLMPDIQSTLALDYGWSGFIVTLPVIIIALSSIPVSKLVGRKGTGKPILFGLTLYGIALCIRSSFGIYGIFFGSALVGLGICFINVLAPTLIKEYFPSRVGPMTGTYTTMMYLFAAISSATAVPVAHKVDSWQIALAMWLPLVLVCLIIWGVQYKKSHPFIPPQDTLSISGGRLLKESPLARWIIVLMASQGFIYFCALSWLPTIIQQSGYGDTEAGLVASVVQICGIPGAMLAGAAVHRFRSQQIPCMMAGGTFLTASLLMVFSQTLTGFLICAVFLGFSMAAAYTLFLCVLTLRAGSPQQAGQLTGVVFLIGYLVASSGPWLMGRVYDWTENWTFPLLALVMASILYGLAGYKAGRNQTIGNS